MKTKLYGASDDLIEIEGFAYDEIDCYEHKRPIKFECSDGTIGTIFYNGEWKINVKICGNKYLRVIDSVGDENRHDEPNATIPSYSDILILDSGIEWIKIKGMVIKDN